MQQTCSNCRYPLQPGSTVCTNCGTPVSAGGGGSYDPTIRAGSPPGSGYGQSAYGAPSAPDPYGVQYSGPSHSSPYGAQQSSPYGAPPPASPYGQPPSSPYGSPPTPQGFGGPPPYGAPVGYPGQLPPPKKSHRGLFIGLGIVGGIVVIAIIGCIALVGFLGNKVKVAVNSVEATATALAAQGGNATIIGPHVTTIQTGTGFDQNNNVVTGETNTFKVGGDAWVVFTVTTQDSSATIQLKILNGGSQTGQSDPETISAGTKVDPYQLTLRNTGSDEVDVYYNGTKEASITFTVTS